MMEKLTDKELISRIRKKDKPAFRALYSRYDQQIFNFILKNIGQRGLAQELMQETFTKVWLAAGQFNGKTGTFRGWLFTIAMNTTRNEMRKKRYTYKYQEISEIHPSHTNLIETANEHPDALLERKERLQHISKALGNLKPELREIITLKHFQQLKFTEISKMTNTPEGTLKARLHRAMAELRKHLDIEALR